MLKLLSLFAVLALTLPVYGQAVSQSSTIISVNPEKAAFWVGQYRDGGGNLRENYGIAHADIYEGQTKRTGLVLTEIGDLAGLVVANCIAAAEAAREQNKKLAIDFHFVGTPWMCSVASENRD